MIIRSAESSDESVLEEMFYLALWVRAGAQPFPRRITSEPNLRPYFEHWGAGPADIGFVAVEELTGVVLGAAWLRLLVEPRGYGFVRKDIPELSVSVVPSARGRGIGSRLLDELIQAASQKKYPAISLSVSANNPALRLYERLGFTPVHASDDSIVMLLDLTPAG
jgi:ribosomal protein S18 acetylase RimI-like enzyme